MFYEIFEKYHGTFFVPKKRRGTPKHDYKSTWYFFITKMLELGFSEIIPSLL